MTARKQTSLADKRRANKERREAVERERRVKSLNIADDIDPSALLRATKLIIHTEIVRMSRAQTAGDPITPNDARKLMQMITTIGSMLTISERTKPDLSGMSEAELETLAGNDEVHKTQ